jgi:hypothetical protein
MPWRGAAVRADQGGEKRMKTKISSLTIINQQGTKSYYVGSEYKSKIQQVEGLITEGL